MLRSGMHIKPTYCCLVTTVNVLHQHFTYYINKRKYKISSLWMVHEEVGASEKLSGTIDKPRLNILIGF